VIQNCIGELAIGDAQRHLAIIRKNGDELMDPDADGRVYWCVNEMVHG
jgi:hypothetical protein|tara:strand:- start:134 stop:277 length:144 start_codon:yes stop_codon:yes gene_type:complete